MAEWNDPDRIIEIIQTFITSPDRGERMLGTILDEVFTKTQPDQRVQAVKQVVDGLGKACREFVGKVVVSRMAADMGRRWHEDVGETPEGSEV